MPRPLTNVEAEAVRLIGSCVAGGALAGLTIALVREWRLHRARPPSAP